MKPLHSLLRRQLKKHFGDPSLIPDELQDCMKSVNDAYYQFDADRNMLERSLDLSSHELLQANAEMRAVFQAFPDLFFWLDYEGKVLDCKGGHKSDLYLPPEKMIGRKIQDSPHEHIRDRLLESFKSVRTTGTIVIMEYSLTAKKSKFFFEARLLPLLENQIIMIVRNITERKKAEKELKAREEELRATIESTDDGILVANSQGTVIHSNQRFAEMWQIPDNLIKTRDDEKLLNHVLDQLSDPQEFLSKVQTLHKSSDPDLDTLLFKDGRVFERLSNPLIIEGKVAGRVWSFRDISERKKAEQEQERLNSELSQKNAELERVVYVTSHDLRTPLVNIQGFNKELGRSVNELYSLLLKNSSSENIQEAITSIVENDIPESQKYISRSISKMDSLLAGLLKLSRLGSAELRIVKINMNKLIADALTVLKTQSKRTGAQIMISELPPCCGDERQVSQLFTNLAENAIKYLDSDRPGIISISGKKEDSRCTYCVEDNGIGINSEYQEKIFDIFHRLNPAKCKGEGLGLTIVQRAVERHDGKIWLESEPGKGSRFYVSLPATKKQINRKYI